MKKILIVLLILITAQNCFAAEMSDWAQDSFVNLSGAGIIGSDTVKKDMKENITRAEFCKMVMGIYRQKKQITLTEEDLNVFYDTKDKNAAAAYKVGIVNGKGENIFAPDDFIQRQEMAVMISRLLENISPDYIKFTNQIISYNKNFFDSAQTAQWAMEDISAVCYYEVIRGVTENTVEPCSYATREASICMMDRVIKTFDIAAASYNIPNVTKSEADFDTGTVSLQWDKTDGAKGYRIIIKRGKEQTVTIDADINTNYIANYKLQPGYDGKYTVYAEAIINEDTSVFSKPVEFEAEQKNVNTEIPNKENNTDKAPVTIDKIIQDILSGQNGTDNSVPQTVDVANTVITEESTGIPAVTEKEKRVFPDGYYFQTEEEARSNMVQVTVPVHCMRADGTKYESTKSLTVNKALAEDVKNIFTEIFEDSSQFPIKDVGGFSWRKTAGGNVSQHSYGTCIDINYNENYYVKPDGTPITGSYWKPYEDPYSIAEDSIVVKTFEKYGWKWGGNAWGDGYNKDYMHFTYLGK
ncbi:MAG: M15 family metallopeptidase [Clostridia bacterium]|nr:M15 family metallopeptidase [Clostridia bacterium]